MLLGRVGQPPDRSRRETGVQDVAVLDVLGRVDVGRDEGVLRVGLRRHLRGAREQVAPLEGLPDRLGFGEHPVPVGEGGPEVRVLLLELVDLLPVAVEAGGLVHVERDDRLPGSLERFGVRHRRASSGSMGGRTARGTLTGRRSRPGGPSLPRCAAPGRSPARRPRRRAARTGAIPPRCGRTRPHSEPTDGGPSPRGSR